MMITKFTIQKTSTSFKKMKKIKILFRLFIISIIATNCVSVKEYEKNYVNDSEMQLSTKKSQKTENNFTLYREAASGADGGKNGGGCGCN